MFQAFPLDTGQIAFNHGQRKIFIRRVAHYFPSCSIDNGFFEQIFDTSDQWIRERTGIVRRCAMLDYDGNFPVLEIARRALMRLIEKTKNDAWKLSSTELVLACQSTTDRHYPGVANSICEAFGLRVPAVNTSNGCASMMYGLELARALIMAGLYNDVLLVNGEPFTRQVDYSDRRNAILFGDAGTAMVVSAESGEFEVLQLELGGAGSSIISSAQAVMASSGFIANVWNRHGRVEALKDEACSRWGRFQQDGRAVREFVLRDVPRQVNSFLKRCGQQVGDVDWLILHQANLRLMEALCSAIDCPAEKHIYNVDTRGNTASAGWVSVLSEALESGRFKTGDRIMAAVFGAGLAWGNLLCVKT